MDACCLISTSCASCVPACHRISHSDYLSRRCSPKRSLPHKLRYTARKVVFAQSDSAGITPWTDSFKASLLWKPYKVTDVRSYTFLAIAVAAAAGSLFSFNLLADKIVAVSCAQGFTGPTSTLQILDTRNGYSPEDIVATMQAWGSSGKGLYLLIEAIDVSSYATAYRGAGMIAFNRMADAVADRFPSFKPPFPPAMFPVFLASLDYFEDALQVLTVVSFNDAWSASSQASPAWTALVQLASVVNVAKWTAVKVGSGSLLAGLTAVLLYEAASLTKRETQ